MPQTIKVSELGNKLPNGIRITTDSDSRIDVETSEYWTRLTEKEYNKVTKALDKISAKGKGYQIYVWYDVSGFNYCVNQQQEDNYAQITVQFDSEFISKSQIPALAKKLDRIIDKVNAAIFN